LLVDSQANLMQSIAIIEYLEETQPEPALLPESPVERARVRALALFVACEIQPLNNLRTQRQLVAQFGAEPQALHAWQLYWCDMGFTALEAQLASHPKTGKYCHGDSPTLADCCLVPQVYNSQRPVVGADLSKWPTISRIYEACLALPEVERSLPRNQPGFEDPSGH
jgi:maleylacetoacetate isomerase